MVKLIVPSEEIKTLDDCKLCGEGKKPVGDVGKKGTVIYKSGDNPSVDWFISLQRSNISDRERGFTLMIMPLGHLTAFSQTYSSRELANNYGLTFAKAHYGMQVIRLEEWEEERGIFSPAAVSYGKCASEINTQEHFHIKAYTFDGDAKQAYPSDTDWIKREAIPDGNSLYVKAKPVIKRELDEERFQHLSGRLVEICNNS